LKRLERLKDFNLCNFSKFFDLLMVSITYQYLIAKLDTAYLKIKKFGKIKKYLTKFGKICILTNEEDKRW